MGEVAFKRKRCGPELPKPSGSVQSRDMNNWVWVFSQPASSKAAVLDTLSPTTIQTSRCTLKLWHLVCHPCFLLLYKNVYESLPEKIIKEESQCHSLDCQARNWLAICGQALAVLHRKWIKLLGDFQLKKKHCKKAETARKQRKADCSETAPLSQQQVLLTVRAPGSWNCFPKFSPAGCQVRAYREWRQIPFIFFKLYFWRKQNYAAVPFFFPPNNF